MQKIIRFIIAATLMVIFLPMPVQAVTMVTTDDASLAVINAGLNSISVNSSSKGLIRFATGHLQTLPAITANDIVKATLFVYTNNVQTAGKLQLSPINSSWSETNVTTANAPAIGLPVLTNARNANKNEYFSVNVTSLVQDWITAPTTNFGLALAPDPSTPDVSVSFDSKEATDTSHPAFIEVVLRGPVGPQGPIGATGAKGATGATGPAVTTSAVCSSASGGSISPYSNGFCSCVGKTISKISSVDTCAVTSDTGSCSADGRIDYSFNQTYNGQCCVCAP